MSKSKEPTRVTLYFSENDTELLNFVNSQGVKRSTFIMSLISKAYKEQLGHSELSNNEILNELKKQNELSNQKLLEDLKQFIKENSVQIASNTPVQEEVVEEEPQVDFTQIPYENADQFTF